MHKMALILLVCPKFCPLVVNVECSHCEATHRLRLFSCLPDLRTMADLKPRVILNHPFAV